LAPAVLTLIGSPTVAHPDGERLTPQPGSKALALLAYLTLEPRPHTREELSDLLWGESPEVEARASLRQALRQVRSSLGDVVCSDRRVVSLSQPLRCDVTSFLEKADSDPEAAAAIDIPRFLAGFSIRHAPRFDDWLAETRANLLQRYAGVLGTLAQDAMDQRRWRDAAQWAERWLACDRLC
jgi:DNA-binding SARP family transcriptional activator